MNQYAEAGFTEEFAQLDVEMDFSENNKQTPVWDRDGAMDRIQDENLLRMVCGIFDQEAPVLLARVHEALSSEQCAEAAVSAHALKAAAANVGAEQCRAIASELEDFSKACKSVEALALLPAFQHALALCRQALAEAGFLA